MVPYYELSMESSRLERLRNDMRGSEVVTLARRAGISSSSITNPRWFRACLKCAANDAIQFGEAYWIACTSYQVSNCVQPIENH